MSVGRLQGLPGASVEGRVGVLLLTVLPGVRIQKVGCVLVTSLRVGERSTLVRIGFRHMCMRASSHSSCSSRLAVQPQNPHRLYGKLHQLSGQGVVFAPYLVGAQSSSGIA